MLKLPELKEQVYDVWKDVVTFNGAVVQPEQFKSEVKTFGDLRFKTTWQKAYASFWAHSIWDSGVTEMTAICYVFNFTPDDWHYPIRHLILEEFLAIPGAVEFIARGLEQIYRGNDQDDKECADGLLELVGGQATGGARGVTARHLRRLTGSSSL